MNTEHSIIGHIYKIDPEYDNDLNETKPGVISPGWHVNATESTDKTKPFEIEVKTPVRTYGFGNTVFLRFKDEQEWDEFVAGFTMEELQCNCTGDEWCELPDHDL